MLNISRSTSPRLACTTLALATLVLATVDIAPAAAQPRGMPSASHCMIDIKPPTDAPAAATGLDTVPAARRAILAKGVNVTNLFPPSAEIPIPDTFAQIRRIGFRHVRVPISPDVYADPPPPWQGALLARLDLAVCTAASLHLGIIIDLHPFHALAPEGGSNEAITANLVTDWRKLASRYGKVAPDYVFFEVLNEPKIPDATDWQAMQETMLHAIRAQAPRNTVILTASPWSTPEVLAALTPSPDRNVVYTFHLYTPMIFTHQTAEWGPPHYDTIHGLDYPARANNVASVARRIAPELQPALAAYGRDFTDGKAIAAQVDLAADWARRNGTFLISTEFGVYNRATPAARAAWLHDVRLAYERRQIGWTVWEYTGGFGIDGDLRLGCGAPHTITEALALCDQ